MKQFGFVFILFTLVLIPITFWGQVSHLHKQIDKIVKYDTEGDLRKIPGYIVGIIDGEKTYVESFGNVVGSTKTLSDKDVFEIGNISKGISYELMHFLDKADVISFEKLVNDCLPQEFINPRLKDTKIKDLLDVNNIFPNVVSGIGISEIDGFHPYVRMDNQVLTKLYRDYVPEDDFLSNVYSNVDYAIIQLILENYLKKDLQNLFDEYLNSYLGTNYFYTKFEQLEETVTPGITRGGKIGKPWEINNFATSIGLKANLEDLLQFARYKIEKHKSKTQDNWEHIFDQMTETWNPQVKAFESMFLIKINSSKKILASNGHSDIHGAFIAICPTTETAVVVLANSAVGTQDLGMLILRMVNNNWKRKSSLSNVK